MTITEKILPLMQKRLLRPGGRSMRRLTLSFPNHDITAPIAIQEFERTRAKHVFNKEHIALIPDHFHPSGHARQQSSAS